MSSVAVPAVFVVRGAGLAMAVVVASLTAQLLSPAGFGEYSFIISLATILSRTFKERTK